MHKHTPAALSNAGLAISGATSPAAPPTLTFTAPPSGALPQLQPVEVFARFPQVTVPACGSLWQRH